MSGVSRERLYRHARAIGEVSRSNCPGGNAWAPADPAQLGHGICRECDRSVLCDSAGILYPHKGGHS